MPKMKPKRKDAREICGWMLRERRSERTTRRFWKDYRVKSSMNGASKEINTNHKNNERYLIIIEQTSQG